MGTFQETVHGLNPQFVAEDEQLSSSKLGIDSTRSISPSLWYHGVVWASSDWICSLSSIASATNSARFRWVYVFSWFFPFLVISTLAVLEFFIEPSMSRAPKLKYDTKAMTIVNTTSAATHSRRPVHLFDAADASSFFCSRSGLVYDEGVTVAMMLPDWKKENENMHSQQEGLDLNRHRDKLSKVFLREMEER